MEYIKLLGILIVILGFAFKLDAILIIIAAAIVTALTGGLGVEGLLTTLGTSFVANRAMTIFILIMLVVGTLERNGLNEAAAKLIGKVKGSTPGMIIGTYGVLRGVLAAFNVSLGGVAGFVRPVVMPMSEGAIQAKGLTANPEHIEKVKGMSSGMENVAWFFCQVLFVGGAGGLLVQSTLAPLGYQVELLDLAIVEIPVGIVAVLAGILFYYFRDKALCKKYYGAQAFSGAKPIKEKAE